MLSTATEPRRLRPTPERLRCGDIRKRPFDVILVLRRMRRVVRPLSALTLLYVISFWALLTGVLEIAAAIRLRKLITGEWLLALSGVASIVFGVVIALFPAAGALALVIWIGADMLLFGALLVALGFRLRARTRSHTPHAAHGVA